MGFSGITALIADLLLLIIGLPISSTPVTCQKRTKNWVWIIMSEKTPETFKQCLQTIGKKSLFIKNLSNINTLQMLRLKWETTPVMFQN